MIPDALEVVRDKSLIGDVVLVDAHVAFVEVEDDKPFAHRQAPQAGDADLESTAGCT